MLNLNQENPLELTKGQKKTIKGFGVLTKDHWKRNETTLRKAIRTKLMKMQDNRCVYCGCPTDDPEDVEHIAHKADYPQFLFTPLNLAYACKNCNQTYKGDTNVVSYLHSDYSRCQFTIVHPYLDDVDHFFDTSGIIIRIRSNLSPQDQDKANTTFQLLHWGDMSVHRRRARYHATQQYCIANNTSIDEMIANASSFKPGIL